MKYNVVCMKWGDKYGAEYVNRLYNMAARNLTLPFDFHCFTDDSRGLSKEIDARPLPEMALPPDRERGWRKLSCFKADFPVQGRILFLDLDTVIVDNIDAYFTMEAGDNLIVIRHWKPSKMHGIGETGVFRYDSGTMAFLYDDFMGDISAAKKAYRHEQAYVTDVMAKRGRLSFWPSEWMPSFKYNCMHPFPLNYFLPPALPKGAKMVIFHGNPTPDQAMSGRTRGTLKRFIRHVRTPQWLKDSWK